MHIASKSSSKYKFEYLWYNANLKFDRDKSITRHIQNKNIQKHYVNSTIYYRKVCRTMWPDHATEQCDQTMLDLFKPSWLESAFWASGTPRCKRPWSKHSEKINIKINLFYQKRYSIQYPLLYCFIKIIIRFSNFYRVKVLL